MRPGSRAGWRGRHPGRRRSHTDGQGNTQKAISDIQGLAAQGVEAPNRLKSAAENGLLDEECQDDGDPDGDIGERRYAKYLVVDELRKTLWHLDRRAAGDADVEAVKDRVHSKRRNDRRHSRIRH